MLAFRMQAPGKNHLPDCAVTAFCCVLLFAERCFSSRRSWRAAHSYVEAFFGPTGGWEAAFDRFLRSPPHGSKDRAAMRDVAAFLATGVDSMCPRGFRALANAAEVSETRASPSGWFRLLFRGRSCIVLGSRV